MGIERVKSVAVKAVLAAGTLLAAALAVEVGARLWVAIKDPPLRDYYAFMKSHPAPYRNAEFYSPGFLAEYLADGGVHTPDGTTLLIPDDRDGIFINVENGRRRTAFQPDESAGRVFLLGGSTVFGVEVPDEHTIASYLQHRLVGRSDTPYRVENVGAVAVNARQQLERLKTLHLRPGDSVIFYDGVNEIYQALYHHHSRGWTAEDLEGPPVNSPLHRRVAITVYNRLYHRSRFVTYFLDPYDTETVPGHLQDPETRGRLVTELAEAYEATLLEAHRFSTDRGATFHHFLQPNLFTVDSRSAYEEQLLVSRHFTPNGLDIGFSYGYPELQAVVRRLAGRGVSSYDLTSLLNERTNGEEFFLDFCHVNHEANRRIAESITAHAFPAD